MCANQTKISWFDSDASCAALVELALLVSVVGWLFDWFEFAPPWFEFAPAPTPQASGLRYFDAARSYGESEEFLVCNVLYCTVLFCPVMALPPPPGESEEFLASWLDGRAHAVRRAPDGSGGGGAVVCGSKWGYAYTAGWRVDTDGAPHEVTLGRERHYITSNHITFHHF